MKTLRLWQGQATAPMFIGWILLAHPTTSLAQTSVSVQWENDAFPEWGDDDYTNGLRVTLDFNETLWWSPFSRRYSNCREQTTTTTAPCRRTTLLFGQNFYTPDDITNPRVEEEERPYAAWLYVGAAARLVDARRQKSLELHLGTTGKYAFGKEVQTGWHELVKADVPQGWGHQVKPVPGLVGVVGAWDDQFRFEKRISGPSKFVGEFIPYYRLTGGNVHVNAAAGFAGRFGYNLSTRWTKKIEPTRSIDSFGSSVVPVMRNPQLQGGRTTSRHWEFSVFGSIEGRAVAWNALLQHDTYTPRELRPIRRGVSDIEVGIALGYKRAHGGFRWVWRSPEYDIGPVSKYGGFFFAWSPIHHRSH